MNRDGAGLLRQIGAVVGGDDERDAGEEALVDVDGLLPRVDEDLVAVLIAGHEAERVPEQDSPCIVGGHARLGRIWSASWER